MDWNKIKAEYIAGGTSYRKLAVKYSVPFSTLKDRAKREKWTDLKTQAQHNADTTLTQSIGEQNGAYTVSIHTVADKLLEKITELLEDRGEHHIPIGSQAIKHLTSALKDIKDVKDIKSDIDLKEQNARIDKLRKEIEGEQKDNRITVTFAEDVKKYGA